MYALLSSVADNSQRPSRNVKGILQDIHFGYACPMSDIQGFKKMLIVGMMSGTSCDAIDAAVVEVAIHNRPKLLYFQTTPMPNHLREPALRLAAPGISEIDTMGALDVALGKAFANAALSAIASAGLKLDTITAIGSHGQTIRHRPQGVDGGPAFTLQIGCPSTIAELTGITTVADFRRRDVAAGGEGAPLVPFAHHLLFAAPGTDVAVVNIGGIANISYLGGEGKIIGFDTGPGNMVMDELMLALSDGRSSFDVDGSLAATGIVDETLLKKLMEHPYFHRQPPKSSGREEFGQGFAKQILAFPGISDADRLATACELTARAIADAQAWLPATPSHWYVCGGGSANRHLMTRLTQLLSPSQVNTTDSYGIPADAVEAVSFALLAQHTLLGLENTKASVTGASRDVCGGQIVPGSNWQVILEQMRTWIQPHT